MFVGAPNTTTALHVDTAGTNFWMALLRGRKRFVFFDTDDAAALYPDAATSAFRADAGKVVARDAEHFNQWPAAAHAAAGAHVAEIGPGDIIFVPAGSPHQVWNLDEPTVAISANYIDATNLELAKAELRASAATSEGAASLLKDFEADGFDAEMRDFDGATAVPWEHFKQDRHLFPRQSVGSILRRVRTEVWEATEGAVAVILGHNGCTMCFHFLNWLLDAVMSNEDVAGRAAFVLVDVLTPANRAFVEAVAPQLAATLPDASGENAEDARGMEHATVAVLHASPGDPGAPLEAAEVIDASKWFRGVQDRWSGTAATAWFQRALRAVDRGAQHTY